ncbi:MAG: DNA polymerase III subunit alpha [Deltaproteobacteria bacterium]|nr:DNA polymerase III subunit alpha [Deltaproteobacteria bacterium]
MIPLTIRSHFSLMWGTAPIERLCQAVRERGFNRMALTDTDNLYGLWPFLRACEREGIRPIVGAEVTDRKSSRRAVCLVENTTGYRNLCRLLSSRHQDSSFNLEKVLAVYASGLVVLTTSVSLMTIWREAGVNVVAALPRRPNNITEKIFRQARRLDLSAVATPGSFFLDPEDYTLHRVLRAIDLNTSLSRLKISDVAPQDAWLADSREYKRRFEIWPETITASQAIAECLTFSGPDHEAILPPWHDPNGRSAAAVLREAAFEGACQRYGHDLPEAVVERLEHELKLIELKSFSSYFLVVRDIIKRSPRICGRGSGAASLAAYCLGITNVCPLKHNLYFERFLNPDRADPPDIDVDFAWDERDDVLASVLKQYDGHAAMVCNHVLFQPRMAIREVAKVFGLMDREIGQVSKRLPWIWRSQESDTGLQTRLEALPEMKGLDFPDPWPEILKLAQRIVGTPRYLSVHPGGVIITPQPIQDYVPVERAPKGVNIVQWEKDGSEDGGLVKIDLLGNRSLGVIRDAINNIHKNGEPFDELHWEPEDDPATQMAVAEGRTMGCFYIESPAMRLLQEKSGVGDFEHLVIHSSIIRPAANEFIREYLRRLKGGGWEPLHPLLADILDETFGIMVYQEDVSKVAVALAGFSHAQADDLRKVMSKKDKQHALRDYWERFARGARARGVDEAQIKAVWDMIMSFGGYSFCKPHSASYARVSFQAAYLKVHYPAEFMAAVISNQGGYYSTFAYVSEARRHGLTILPPDVNSSELRWKGRKGLIRAGLQSIKGLSLKTQERIVLRRRNGPYKYLEDFLSCVHPDEREARALIHSGALDSLAPGQDHAYLIWKIAGWQRRKDRLFRESQTGNLFVSQEEPSPDFPPDSEIERLRRQFAVLGFLTDRHPIVLFANALPREGLVKAADLKRHAGRRVRLAGWLITGKVVSAKHGDPMRFLTFEDETGLVETTFFPEAHRRFCHMLDWGRPYILTGKAEEDYGALTLTVDQVRRVC